MEHFWHQDRSTLLEQVVLRAPMKMGGKGKQPGNIGERGWGNTTGSERRDGVTQKWETTEAGGHEGMGRGNINSERVHYPHILCHSAVKRYNTHICSNCKQKQVSRVIVIFEISLAYNAVKTWVFLKLQANHVQKQ